MITILLKKVVYIHMFLIG